uniref:non-ribosomal peptide synthetase n=1 Tax=uncultured Aquimarina sp. TaxID=575652 RepID=UPI0026373661
NAVDNLDITLQPQDLCYVIYTSGTTGKPKGVMIEHSGIVNRLEWMQSMYPLTSEDIILQKTPYIFDVSVWELLWANWYGAKIVMAKPEGHKDSEYLHELIKKHEVTTLHFVPSMLIAYNYYLSKQQFKFNGSVRQIFCSGEALNKKAVIETYENSKNGSLKVHNLYGPTEASIDVTFYETTLDKDVYIGRPIANTQTYVLDNTQNPVPVGIVGELYISGAGIARGYLNREELTKERFVTNPFGTELDKANGYTRMYKTGDLVRWLSDGNLEYIGRNDDQVKVRGYRIELTEIENALSKIEGIAQSCLLVKERTTDSGVTKYLVGYYVPSNQGMDITQKTLTEKLSKELPEYMIPSTFVKMEAFPMTVNGKLDKRALPEPTLDSLETYVAPTSELEKALCEIWESVLAVERIGITDHFFRIGGDSILSIQVSGRIRDLGYSCQVKDLFEYTTIEQLSVYLETATSLTAIEREEGTLKGSFSYLPVQQWFFDQVVTNTFKSPDHFNQSFMIRVPELAIDKLNFALEALVQYHDMFRVTFKNGAQSYDSSIGTSQLQTLDIRDHDTSEISEILTLWQSNFSLSEGPLFQFGYLFGYNDGSARVFMALHHLIVDAVSWRILASDLERLYKGEVLSPKGTSYRQWVDKLKTYPTLYPLEIRYWQNQVANLPNYNTLEIADRKSHLIEFSKEQTTALLKECSKTYHTEINDLLLTAFSTALSKLIDSNIVGITLEGHGRELLFDEIDHSRTLGWHTSMFPVALSIQGDLSQDIPSVKEQLRNIPNKGLGFGSFAVLENVPYDFSDMPKTSFNYLGQFEEGSTKKDWQLVAEPGGESVHSDNKGYYIIDVNGGVSSGVLKFSISTYLNESDTQILLSTFSNTLVSIISHCRERLEEVGNWFTPSDFSLTTISMPLLDRLQTDALAKNNSIAAIYPANSLQQGFLYHTIKQPEDDAYRLQLLLDYDIELDVPLYLKAWEYCIDKYAILRTAFNWEEDLLQVIYSKGELSHIYHDISDLKSQGDIDKSICEIQLADRSIGYDMSNPTLLRLHIIKQSTDKYTILKSEHHSISDGWGTPVVINQVHQYYKLLQQGQHIDIKENTVYERAQEYIQTHKNTVESYWKSAVASLDGLMDITPLLDRPLDFTAYREVISPKELDLDIVSDRFDYTKEILQKNGLTINTLVQFLWHKLLSVYVNNTQTVVGTTISGRDLPIKGIEEGVGLFINTLPLIVDWNTNRSVIDQLHHIQKRLRELNDNAIADLSSIHLEGQRLFQSLLVFENYPITDDLKNENSLSVSFRGSKEKSDYLLGLTASEDAKGLHLKLEYDGFYLSEEKAAMHLDAMSFLLDQLIKDINQPQSQLSILSTENYETIVYDWNSTHIEYPKEETVISLFESQVEKTPDHIAIVYDGKELTYRDLNEQSNRLAHYLHHTYKLEPDDLVGIMLDRSSWSIISILGVLKTGAAYVPIDSNYPESRKSFIIEETDLKVLIIESENLFDVIEYKVAVFSIDVEFDKLLQNDIYAKNPGLPISAKDLCYVIYTSGTTGKPKGSMVGHHAVVSLVCNDYINVEPEDVFAFLASPSFDAATFEIWTPLLKGNSLVIPNAVKNLVSNTQNFKAFLENNSVSILWLNKTLFESIYFENTAMFRNLNYLIIGGEALDKNVVQQLGRSNKKPKHFLNGYGPTESTTFTCVFDLYRDIKGANVPIGKPIGNRKVYVLDIFEQPVPEGVIGELYIGGAGVARGYLKRPKLTEERFVKNPFATTEDENNGYTSLYKTGDLVRWLPDGNLEYIGRNDDQIKMRGYRIELAEIEAALSGIAGVTQSCVMVNERTTDKGTNKYLVGYYILSDDEITISSESLIKKLSSKLPDYMIPSMLVEMETFPMTHNGKLDKRALPEPEFTNAESYVAPETELEKELCSIWASILGIEKVGVTDDFFRMGGNSILAVKVAHRISEVLGKEVRVSNILTNNNIKLLSEKLMSETVDSSEHVDWEF